MPNLEICLIVSALAAEWIEIVQNIPVNVIKGSPPSRRSGLKYDTYGHFERFCFVSALAAEWIEMLAYVPM